MAVANASHGIGTDSSIEIDRWPVFATVGRPGHRLKELQQINLRISAKRLLWVETSGQLA